MKRTFYIVGIILIVILIAVWMFLLFASDEQKTDIYNRFGISGSPEEGIFEEVIDAIIPDVFQKQYLRQLTTKRVIGYTEVATASSTLVYFVEGGTGHVYTIDPMIEGSENRVSNVTIPMATQAVISADGAYIAIHSGNQTESALTILTRNGQLYDTYNLEEPVRDFTISTNGDLLYTTTGGSGLSGNAFDIATKTTRPLFEIPFREATIVWGNTPKGPHYVYPKTSRYLEGYLYVVKDGEFSRLPASGFGLTATADGERILHSSLKNGAYTTSLLDEAKLTSLELPSPFIPEKCTFGSEKIFCALSETTSMDYGFPDNWYRGETSFIDSIWEISNDTTWAALVVDTLKESGREIDATNLATGSTDALLYFINKNDHALWVYEFEVTNSTSE
jgi:hypothetical protein